MVYVQYFLIYFKLYIILIQGIRYIQDVIFNKFNTKFIILSVVLKLSYSYIFFFE